MDASRDHGGEGAGPTPFEAFLCSAAACSAIDVVSILEKKRQTVKEYRIEFSFEQKEGEFPHPLENLRVTHVIRGENIDPSAIEQAVRLSDEKYCSVIASLRANVSVSSDWKVEP